MQSGPQFYLQNSHQHLQLVQNQVLKSTILPTSSVPVRFTWQLTVPMILLPHIYSPCHSCLPQTGMSERY